ncbi:MAG: ribosome small subunit-dependent GTPase A [Rhodocyclaceae bacterium]|nr:ribosome small subunit-dependent GTPase A [Rhodocyclaceae bacterium]MBK6907413.1 ribosome small subunit-dependent GTPase A [Rhodocyclaceae bacterium]
MSAPQSGTIIAAFGRHYDVAMADGSTRTGYPRGKRSAYACGDEVTLSDDGQLLGHSERRSLLHRSDAFREKLLAANATQLIVVVATEPSFSDELISRALIAAENQGLRALIVLNKTDLTDALPAAYAVLAPFAGLGYPIVELSAHTSIAPLQTFLVGQVSILVGQSGMGKSTLTNALVPAAAAATREISAALDTGKHTTTCTRLYRLDAAGSALIDSPGLQEFGLAHLGRDEIAAGFIEFQPYIGHCRYRDCRHQHEPDCAIKSAVAQGKIHPRRLQHFAALMDQLAARPNY